MYDLLIADDEQIERDALRYIITRGCDGIDTILEAANGREAIEIAHREGPEIILMDVKMPGTNGVEAAREILEARPDTRIVFLTAFDYFDYAQQAVRLGARDFIVKPANDDRVFAVLNRLVNELDEERTAREEHLEAENKLKRVKTLLERELVTGVLGSELSSEQIADYLQIMGFEPEGLFAVSLQIDFSSYPTGVSSASHRRVLTSRCAGALAKRFQSAGFSVLRAEEDGIVNVLLVREGAGNGREAGGGSGREAGGGRGREAGNGGEAGESTLVQAGRTAVEVAGEAAAAISREFALSVYMGVDPSPSSEGDIARAFRHVCVARSRAIERGTNVVNGSDVRDMDQAVLKVEEPAPGQETVGRHDYPYELERQICDAISADDADSAHQAGAEAVEQLWAAAGECGPVRRRLLELVTIVSRQFDLDPDSLTYEDVAVLDRVESACSPADFRTVMGEAMDALLRERTEVSRSPSHIHVERVRRYIEEHYDRPLSLEDAAAKARLSPHYFSRVFKSYTGMTFVDFLNSVRVAEAKRLLRSSRLSIKEISTDVGFYDANYFTRVFKQHARITPTDYRNNTIV